MGKYNVIPTIISVKEDRRAQDEANYISQRRAIEDPRADRQANRVDAARQAGIDQYGVLAGDPTSYGQLEGITQRKELHPLEVEGKQASNESTRTTTEGNKADNAAKLDARAREAASRTLDAIDASGAQTVADVAQKFPPAVLAQLGTDPAKFPDLLKHLQEYPDLKTGIKTLRDGLLGAEKVDSIQTGLVDGKPVMYGVGERQAPGVLPVAPDDRMHGLNVQAKEAEIAAARALANQRNTPKPGKGAAVRDPKAVERVNSLVDEAMGLVAEGARKGYIPSEQQDQVTRGGAQAAQTPVIGPLVQGLVAPEAQTTRDKITGTTNAILREYVKAMGIGVGSINSNFELQNIQSIIDNAGSSAEARLRSLARVKELLGSDEFAAKVLAAETGGAAPVEAPAAPSVHPDRRAELDAKYGRQ